MKVIAYISGTTSVNDDQSRNWLAMLKLAHLKDGAWVYDPRIEATRDLTGKLEGTHNQSELEAVKQVLLSMKREGVCIEFVTNSEYIVGVLSRHWKPARNQALIAEVKTLLSKFTVTFRRDTNPAQA